MTMRPIDKVMIVILAAMIASTAFLLCLASEKYAMADGTTILTDPTPTPMPEVVQLDAEPTPEFTAMPKPIATICCYDWDEITLNTIARGMYGLETWNEKYGYVLTSVNRYLSGDKDIDGKPLYGSGSLIGIASNQSEFFFYDEHANITKENLELANFMLNAAFTERFTCYFTGFPFPTNAVFFGWNNDDKPIVRCEKGGEPFLLSYNWQGVLP